MLININVCPSVACRDLSYGVPTPAERVPWGRQPQWVVPLAFPEGNTEGVDRNKTVPQCPSDPEGPPFTSQEEWKLTGTRHLP